MSGPIELVAGAGLAGAFLVLAFLIYRQQKQGIVPALRPLEGVNALARLAERSLEEGRRIQLALGTGSIASAQSAETLMGLIVLDHLAEQGKLSHRLPLVTSADASTHLLAADALYAAAKGSDMVADARFLAPTRAAYGAASRALIQHEQLGLTAAVGSFSDEYLFLAAQQPDGAHVMPAVELAATAHLESIPLVYLTARTPVIGEESFALGAYLARHPAHLASLTLQDGVRLLLIVAILLGVLLRSLGVL